MTKKLQNSRPLDIALSIVVPTYNERDNVPTLLATLRDALTGITTEIIFVDDSDDDTPQVIRAARDEMASKQFIITLLHRPAGPTRTGGLAGAVKLGLARARAAYVAVIDADLQHPPERLRVLYERAVKHNADVVIATRYRPGGSYEGLDGMHRRLISVGLKWVAKVLFPDQLLRVSDPLGGFFLIRRGLLKGVTLRPVGYKISLELLIRCRWAKLVEVPYHFQARNAGASKSDLRQGLLVLRHMARLIREVPAAARFWKFCLVGASGAVINLGIFALALQHQWPVILAWLLATEISLLTNFALHHLITWRELGRDRWARRLASFHGTVAIGTACTLALFTLFAKLSHAPFLSQALALVIGTFINYWLARNLTFADYSAQLQKATKATRTALQPLPSPISVTVAP